MRNGLRQAKYFPRPPKADGPKEYLEVLELAPPIRRCGCDDTCAERRCPLQIRDSEECNNTAQIFEAVLDGRPGKAPAALCRELLDCLELLARAITDFVSYPILR